MATTTRLLTYDDLEGIPQEREGDNHELIGGVLYVTPSPIPMHEEIRFNLALLVGNAVRRDNLGKVYVQVDVVLTPPDVLIPDLVFIGRDHLQIVGPTAIEGAPDLVVEVLSPSTRGRDLGAKLALYQQHGVREYWVADPVAHTLTIRVLEGDRYRIVAEENGVLGSTVIPGLVIDVARLFAGIANARS